MNHKFCLYYKHAYTSSMNILSIRTLKYTSMYFNAAYKHILSSVLCVAISIFLSNGLSFSYFLQCVHASLLVIRHSYHTPIVNHTQRRMAVNRDFCKCLETLAVVTSFTQCKGPSCSFHFDL